MKSVFFLLGMVAVSMGQDRSLPRFSDDQIDLVLRNDRLFHRYYKCLMQNEDCSRNATEMRRFIPDAISNNCQQCNEAQKAQVRKVFRYMAVHRPVEWQQILQKYDPGNRHANVIRSYLN